LIQKQARVFGGLERGILGKKKEWFRYFGEYFGRCEFLRVQPLLEEGYRDALADNPYDFFSNDFWVIGPQLLHGKPLAGQERYLVSGVNCVARIVINEQEYIAIFVTLVKQGLQISGERNERCG